MIILSRQLTLQKILMQNNMFTGIVEEVGKISALTKGDKSMKLKVECYKVTEGLLLGDSVAVNGVCLTAVNFGSNFFEADVSYETIAKTSLNYIKSGSVVNLERALTVSSRLGGHIVQGHVDCTGKILNITKYGDSYKLVISYPEYLDRYIVSKCSVAIDGISLTAADVKNKSFEVAVIPHTFENTNLKYKKNGDIVNLESDIIARYVEKMIYLDEKDDKLKSLISSFKR